MEKYVGFYDCIKNNNKLIFSDINQNSLIEYDLDRNYGKIIALFQNEQMRQKCLHKRILEWGGSLFFFPEFGKNIIRYYPETGEMEEFPVFINGVSRTGKTKIAGIAKKGTKVFLFPQYICQPLLKFDLETGSMESLTWWNDEIRTVFKKETVPFAVSIEYDGDIVWMALRETGLFIEFSLSTLELKYHEVKLPGIANNMLTKIGEEFWITQLSEAKIIKSDQEGNAEEYQAMGMECGALALFSKVIFHAGKYYVLPAYSDKLGLVDMEKKQIYLNSLPADKISSEDAEKSKWPVFQEYCIEDDTAYIYPLRADYMMILKIDGTIKFRRFTVQEEIPVEARRNYLRNTKSDYCLLAEGHEFSLMDYFQINTDSKPQILNRKADAGDKIHRYMTQKKV